LAIATSLWKTTVESFRDRVASREPAPAGVSVSAVSASLGFALVEKVLRIASQRKDFGGDRKRLVFLIDAAQAASARLARWADEDVAAFHQYLASKRARDAIAIDAALRMAIQIPLQIARESVTGLDLCAMVAGLIPAAVAADLGTAVVLLAGAARATLLSVDANLVQISGDSQFYRDVLAERQELENQALHKAEKLLEQTNSNAP